MFFLIAWRNIKRNKRRSIVSVILSAFCCAFLIWAQALNDGAHYKMIADSVEIYTGYLQVQAPDYLDHKNYDNLIFDVAAAKEQLQNDHELKAIASRFETFALYAAQGDSVGGMLIGIEPTEESKISKIQRALKEGSYLRDEDTNSVYIGEDLAKRLEVGLGDEIVYISSAVDYSLAAGKLIVKGIFKTNLMDFDRQMAFVNKKYLDGEFIAENIASQIVLQPKDTARVFKIIKKLQPLMAAQQLRLVSWRETMSGFVQFVELDNAFGAVTWSLLIIVVFFVVMIFSLISVFQRTRELGILRALGTKQAEIFKLLLTEGVILGLMAIIIGGTIGLLLSYYFQVHPLELNFSEDVKELYRQYGMIDMVIPSKLTMYSFLLGIIPVFLLNILALIFPAWQINRKKPIEAIEER